MLQNACFLAKFGADTAENEQHLAEILPIGRRVRRSGRSHRRAAERAAAIRGADRGRREGEAGGRCVCNFIVTSGASCRSQAIALVQ